MKVIKKVDGNEIAKVYIASSCEGKLIEFVESTQPPLTFREKWVLIISTLYGCPVNCKICDAGGKYQGKLSREELLFQIDYPVNRCFPDGYINTQKFKVQFARMGDPAFNDNVLDVLEIIPDRYHYSNFIPSLSTIAPKGTEAFFERLLRIKKSLYAQTFQLQFSIHTTDRKQRDELIPIKKLDFQEIADYGQDFYQGQGKKITLNFALGKENILDVETLHHYFDPGRFLIKLTPVNPTLKSRNNNVQSFINPANHATELINNLEQAGYDVILSIGEWEENKIGSNCGQYVNALSQDCTKLEEGYTYKVMDA